MEVVVVRSAEDRKQVTSTEINGDLNILIKYIARGHIAPPCLILAVDEMEPGDFFFRKTYLALDMSPTALLVADAYIFAKLRGEMLQCGSIFF